MTDESRTELEQRVDIARARARIWTAVTVTIVCVAVLASVTVAFFAVYNSSQRETTNAEQFKLNEQSIGRLTEALEEARTALAEVTAVNKDLEQCSKRFDTDVSTTLSAFLSAIGDLAVAGFSTPPAPAPDRQTAIDAAVTTLDNALDAYTTAIDTRSAWQEADTPLPCPLNP